MDKLLNLRSGYRTKSLTPKLDAIRILLLREQGYSYDEIAEILHLDNRAHVHRALKNALQDVVKTPLEEFRALNITRMDQMIKTHWSKAVDLQDKQHWDAVDVVFRAIQIQNALCGVLNEAERNKQLGALLNTQFNIIVQDSKAKEEIIRGIKAIPERAEAITGLGKG